MLIVKGLDILTESTPPSVSGVCSSLEKSHPPTIQSSVSVSSQRVNGVNPSSALWFWLSLHAMQSLGSWPAHCVAALSPLSLSLLYTLGFSISPSSQALTLVCKLSTRLLDPFTADTHFTGQCMGLDLGAIRLEIGPLTVSCKSPGSVSAICVGSYLVREGGGVTLV